MKVKSIDMLIATDADATVYIRATIIIMNSQNACNSLSCDTSSDFQLCRDIKSNIQQTLIRVNRIFIQVQVLYFFEVVKPRAPLNS